MFSTLRLVLPILLALFIAFAGGSFSVHYSLQNFGGADAIQIGPWSAYPQAGDEDVYAQAKRGRSSDIILGRAEGLSFYLNTDSEGRALQGGCRYNLYGSVPEARFFTLFVTDSSHKVIKAAANLPDKLFSQDIMREENGNFTILLSPYPQEGNWLATPKTSYTVQLNLYDTPISSAAGLSPRAMPAIIKIKGKNCD